MRNVRRISTLLIVYVCIGSGYAQMNNDCGLDKFQCRDGQCIASTLLCDGRRNCRDSSDETEAECNKPEVLCHPYAFRCNYGACVNGNSVCNGIQDCDDNSDETQPQCFGNPVFTCSNGQRIQSSDLCDGRRNCADGSDETSELCRSLRCPSTAFRCSYGACIDGDLRCNGEVDCADGSDEDSKLCRGYAWPTPLPTILPPVTERPSSRPTTSTVTTRPIQTPRPIPTGANTCRAPPQLQNGQWKLRSQCSSGQECYVVEGTQLGLGSHLVYSCNSGYEIIGPPDVFCSGGQWINIPGCREIRCTPLTTASVQATCTYDDRWVSCESPVRPRTRAVLQCRNSYRPENIDQLSGQRRNVRCNANGQWEPAPMRCIPECGIIPPNVKPTVVGGIRPNITEFPWHATLYRDEPSEPKKFFCGASIVQENVLITAAHCVYDEDTRQLIKANSIYILTGNIYRDYNYRHNENLVKRNQVKRIYIVRSYLGLVGNYLWDIAILELVTPFVLSTWLVPVCIDTLNDRNVLEVGSLGKLAGFGRTAHGESSALLQALTVPVISLSQCRSVSQNANTEQFITNDKFCAGYTNGSSVCDGDSGGGLVFRTNLWYLRGIVSVSLGSIQEGGNVHCDNNLYSLYTDVSKHISWIQDVITKIEQNQIHILCADESQTRCS
ncbi:modular serine protease-like [Solenopsis invicta]|uniref:modular serine protease-like n=1 Tax=Solenopsis invicta TaxID=13686 RepID=UPI000595FC85|nr:modular serine protease-like [Solenopsis invicta]